MKRASLLPAENPYVDSPILGNHLQDQTAQAMKIWFPQKLRITLQAQNFHHHLLV